MKEFRIAFTFDGDDDAEAALFAALRDLLEEFFEEEVSNIAVTHE